MGGKAVFDDVKIAAFCWGIAAPLTVKYLADHGAKVLRIESSKQIDMVRLVAPYKDNISGVNRSLFFGTYNNNQYSINIDLKHPQGLEVAKKIISWADIVVESMLPGAMKRLRLSYEETKKIKPDIIMLSTCNQGQTGPDALLKGFGTQLTAGAGFAHVTGYPDRPPVAPGMMGYTDICSARLGATALIAALANHRRTGEGQYIDLSQLEAGVMFLSSQILDFDINSRVANRTGNTSPCAAPHGAYPSKGQDEWCVISVFDDQDWRNFCNALANPAWTEDPQFSTLKARKENEERLDAMVAAWTINLSAEQIMVKLQSHGVSAGIVQSSKDLYQDP
ncbi:MAG: CoA transferase, partial [Desulfatiglandales bacterium]|nr:CoA transferase [Desulfatiglandales bacterium]